VTSSAASDRFDVVVVGGGIAGLATAHRLIRLEPGLRVVVLESEALAGGKLGTASVAGIKVDTAADAFLARVSGAVELAHELGLGDELIAPATGQAAVLTHGVLRDLPSGLVLGVPTDLDSLAASGILSAEGLAEAASDASVAHPLPAQDRSVAEAIGSHLGREVVERLVDPLLGGISAANCDDLSIDAVAPQLAAAALQPHLMAALVEQQAVAARGQIGVTETRPVFLAPRGGVHQLVSALIDALGERVRCGVAVQAVEQDQGEWRVTTSQGRLVADHVVLATPAPITAGLLQGHPGLSAALAEIRYASVALLVMAYRASDVSLPPGSGMLVPRPEGRLVTAASWWDHKWPHLRDGEHVLIRASVGRIDDTRFASLGDDELGAGVHEDLASMTGVVLRGTPVDTHVARWMSSFAQYDVGHLTRIDHLEAALPRGLSLAGATLRGVGLPACIRSADAAAHEAIGQLGGNP
jgi:protoporphyrinogen/coproporphyrinogen III oxidase